MMGQSKQLLLMVHGDEKRNHQVDFYRPLSVLGVCQTLNVARKMKNDSQAAPEYIFASPSLYIRQTAQILHQAFPLSVLVLRDNLYVDDERALLNFLTHLDDIFGCLLLVAYEAPLYQLTIRLTGKKADFRHSSCVSIHWPQEQSWEKITQNKGELVDFWHP
jgi:phosphohistidine phosphatase SixA